MGLWSRVTLLFRARATAAIDRAEDPRETLSYAEDAQRDLLLRVRRGLVDVSASKHQIAQQTDRMRERIRLLEEQARQALIVGREDLARRILERRQSAKAELAVLEVQVEEVAREEDRLVQTEQELAARIEQFRGRRELLTARYTAAEAQVAVNGALTGVSGELEKLGRALTRAEEKTDRMQARANALGELLGQSDLALPIGQDDPIDREIRQIMAAGSLEAELESMKREVARRGAIRSAMPLPRLTAGQPRESGPELGREVQD